MSKRSTAPSEITGSTGGEQRYQRSALQSLLEPAIKALGYELVLLEAVGKGKLQTLRIYIDKLDAGAGPINVDDCAKVSRYVSTLLDAEDPIPGHYVLEVSSPGIDRPLVKPGDFTRFAGERVSVRTRSHHLGRRRFIGDLQGVEGDKVLVEVDGEVYALPLDDIERANLSVE